MDSTNSNFTINCESNPALYKKCQVLWMETWSEDSMKKVSCIDCDLLKLVSLNITELWWIRSRYLWLWRNNYHCTYLIPLYTYTKMENSTEQWSIISIVILPVTLCFVRSVGWLEQHADYYDSDQTQHLRTKYGLQENVKGSCILFVCQGFGVRLACRGDFCEWLPEASPIKWS